MEHHTRAGMAHRAAVRAVEAARAALDAVQHDYTRGAVAWATVEASRSAWHAAQQAEATCASALDPGMMLTT